MLPSAYLRSYSSSSATSIRMPSTNAMSVYAEVYCVVYYEARMTNAEYKPYMFGAFSYDIKSTLEDMGDLDRRRMIRNGKRTVAYSLGEDGERLDGDLRPATSFPKRLILGRRN